MLPCIPCSSTKHAFKELTAHMKGMVFKAFKIYRNLRPRSVVNETIAMAMETMTTCSDKTAVVTLPEEEIKEWEVEVDSGVFITFVSRPLGGNLIKKIRFSKDNFNSIGAKMWWMDNYERITELYSVKRTNLPWESVTVSTEDNLVAPSCSPEGDPVQTRCNSHDSVQTTTRVLHSTPMSSTGSSATSDDSDFEEEWDEQDECEPGVSMTIRSYADGTRKIKHVYFSPEKFDEETAVAWWEENKARVYDRYVVFFVF